MPTRTACCSIPGCSRLVVNGGRCGGTCCGGRCRQRKPSGDSTGYGRAWRATRDPFIEANPQCVGDGTGNHAPNCNGVATVADHHPLTRRQLLAQGVSDPDAWHRLVARSGPCHSRKTVRFDGGYGNIPRPR